MNDKITISLPDAWAQVQALTNKLADAQYVVAT